MNLNKNNYHWATKDKWMYGFSLVLFLGAVLLLGTFSYWLSAALVSLYLLTNLLQAGCIVGCPYRGKYCPAIFGIYASNSLSEFLYANSM